MRRRPWHLSLICTALLALLGTGVSVQSPSLDTQLLDAAGRGDLAAVTDLLRRGASISAENWRGATALCSAAEHGHVDVVKVLIEWGADLDARDLEWGRTSLINITVPPSDKKHADAEAAIMKLLLEKGAGSDGESLQTLIQRGQYEAAKAIIARGRAFRSYLNNALEQARKGKDPSLVEALIKAGATDPQPIDSPGSIERLMLVAGAYRSASGQTLILRPVLNQEEIELLKAASREAGASARTVSYQQLLLERQDRPKVSITPVDLTVLRAHDMKTVVRVKGSTLPPAEITLRENGRVDTFKRTGDAPPPVTRTAKADAVPPAVPVAPPLTVAKIATTPEWPAFRGPGSSGVLDGANPPTTWNAEKGTNVKWKTPIPGLAHSSPIVWGNRVFVTSAVPMTDAKPIFKAGKGSASTAESANQSTKDDVTHSWRVYALDKQTGKILWNRVSHEGVPRSARHVNESQANSTPVTDGTHLVAFFGSEGLYTYDLDGKLLWKKDLGLLKSGYVMDPTYEWNTASSPIIYKNSVILQVDLVSGSFITAFDIKTGKQIWRTERSDEVPSWATPFIYEGPKHTELVTLASMFARGYNPDTGKELWKLGKHATHATPTPVAGHGLIFLTSGSGNTIQPIYALRPGAEGDITLNDDESANTFVAWSTVRGGAFLSTPILYGDLLYVCGGEGILAAYEPVSGKRVYQVRLPPNNYTASGVAADGKLYFPNVDGDVVVVKAGPKFEQLAVNPMGEVIQASPAVSKNMIIFRTQNNVIAVADTAASAATPK